MISCNYSLAFLSNYRMDMCLFHAEISIFRNNFTSGDTLFKIVNLMFKIRYQLSKYLIG